MLSGFRIHSPHTAGVCAYHFLTGLAAEGLVELRHVRSHIVDAEHGQRMRVGSHRHTRYLRPHIRAPRVSVGEEKSLPIGPAIRTFIVKRFALLLEFSLESVEREMDAAVIRSIFALGEQTVLLNAGTGLGNIFRVFI